MLDCSIYTYADLYYCQAHMYDIMVRGNLGPMFLGKRAKKGPGTHRLAHVRNPLPSGFPGISLLVVPLMLKIERSVSNTLVKIGRLFTCNTEDLADSFTTCTG